MKGWLEFTYKTKKGLETRMTSDELVMEEAVLFAEDLQRTGRVKETVFLDHRDSYWTVKEMHKYLQEVETEPHNITVYFDGNFDRDQKRAGLGLAVYYEKNGKRFRTRKNLPMDHLETNNEAEYAALYAGVEELVKLDVRHMPVLFAGDSQVVINQLSGEWPCLEEKLHHWADKIETELNQYGITPEFHLLERNNNQEADQLASQALKNIEISSSLELNWRHIYVSTSKRMSEQKKEGFAINNNSEEELRRELSSMRKTLEEINQKMEPAESKSLLKESVRALLIGIFLIGPAGAVLLALFSL